VKGEGENGVLTLLSLENKQSRVFINYIEKADANKLGTQTTPSIGLISATSAAAHRRITNARRTGPMPMPFRCAIRAPQPSERVRAGS
jgi:hypothetical protein